MIINIRKDISSQLFPRFWNRVFPDKIRNYPCQYAYGNCCYSTCSSRHKKRCQCTSSNNTKHCTQYILDNRFLGRLWIRYNSISITEASTSDNGNCQIEQFTSRITCNKFRI
ncbi:Uncharacterised protein [Kingella denitrificans]|nr:Uncharacterised protein [Kingella denitrificans]